MLNTCASTTQPGCTPGQASPFSHFSARQAFAYAIDRVTYNKLRNDNLFQNASGPFAPGSDGYVADTGLPTFDPGKAKAAAAQYQQETGKPLTFTLNHTADTDTTADAVLLQQMLKQNAGINITLNAVPDQSTLINIAVGRKFDATVWRNHPGGDPDAQYVWWHCNNGTAAADASDPMTPNCDNIVNFGGFNDPVINKAFDDARTNPDLAARTADYQTINKQFAKELYDLWGQWVLWTVAMKPDVHGVLNIPLPDGGAMYDGLATGHPVLGMWCDGGKC
jgi:peptide/nickel transport system substrate-binding protein